jgi:hypothetical protein
LARQEGAAEGHKLRTDTTTVETKSGALEVVNHGRAVKHRLLEISRATKSQTEVSRQRMRDSYHKLLALTGKLVRQADKVVEW